MMQVNVHLFYTICSGYDPSWANAGLLLKELFHPHKKDRTKKIKKTHAELTLLARGSWAVWPQIDPGWDCYNQTEIIATV